MAGIIMDVLFYTAAYATLFISIFWFVTLFTAEKKKAVRPANPPLSIIVPAYNEENNIEKCIASLENQKYPGLKIIVVDDGSTDGTGSLVKGLARKYGNIKYLKKPNSGKASSLNYGLEHIETKLFGFIDGDTFLSDNALLNMAGFVHGKTASVIATIKPYNPKNRIERMQKIEYMLSSFTRKLMSFIDSLYYTPGFAIYDTRIIKKLGGFDEKNITEDLEIGLRLKSRGYRIENSLEDSAYTVVPKSFRALFRQRLRWYRGYIHNSRKYSHMMLNKQYGDLGMFVLPINYFLLAFIVPFLFVAIYDSIISIAQRIIDVFIVNFDVYYLISTAPGSMVTPSTFFFAVTIIAFFIMIKFSNARIKEKISKIDYIVYIAIYPFLNMMLWVAALAYELAGAKRKW